jgi:hypothetical protein
LFRQENCFIRKNVKYFPKISIASTNTKKKSLFTKKILKKMKNSKEQGLLGGERKLVCADTSAQEAELDRLIYALYDLTEEEIKIVVKL